MEKLRQQAQKTFNLSEKLLKIDMKYATKGGFWTSLRFFVTSAMSVVTFIAFGNLLPKETYGVYSYLISLAGSLSFLILSGTGTGVMRAFARGQEKILNYAIRLQLKYNSIAIATIGLVGVYYLIKSNFLFGISLIILAVSLPLTSIYHTYEFVLLGKKKIKTIAIISGFSAIIATAFTVGVLYITKDVLILVATFAIVSLVPNIFGHLYIKRIIPQGEPSAEEVAEFRKTSFHLTGAGLIGSLAQYIDKIVLFQVAGPAALAVYGFAIAGPDRVKGLLKNWLSIGQPNFAQRSIQEIKQVFYRRIITMFFLGLILSAISIAMAPILFKIFLPKYLDAIPYAQIYSLGLIVIPISVYVGLIFNAQNMLKAIYMISVSTQASRIPLFVIAGWFFKTWGLVWAALISYSLGAILSVIIWEIETKRLAQKNQTI